MQISKLLSHINPSSSQSTKQIPKHITKHTYTNTKHTFSKSWPLKAKARTCWYCWLFRLIDQYQSKEKFKKEWAGNNKQMAEHNDNMGGKYEWQGSPLSQHRWRGGCETWCSLGAARSKRMTRDWSTPPSPALDMCWTGTCQTDTSRCAVPVWSVYNNIGHNGQSRECDSSIF